LHFTHCIISSLHFTFGQQIILKAREDATPVPLEEKLLCLVCLAYLLFASLHIMAVDPKYENIDAPQFVDFHNLDDSSAAEPERYFGT